MKRCHLWQFTAGLAADSDGWLGRRWAAHRQQCPRCAAAWEQHEWIERRLIAEGQREEPLPAPARLAARVAAGVARIERQPAGRRASGRWISALSATAGSIALLVGLLWWNRFPPPAMDPLTPTSLSALEAARARIPLPDSERLLAVKDAVERPLRDELEAMKADARAVTEFLSRTLLPTELLATRKE